jgi:hypothetical protein
VTTPNRNQIYTEAKRLFFEFEHRNGNHTTVNPEYSELLESGFVAQAQSNLMSNPETLYGLTQPATTKPDQQPKPTDFFDLLDLAEIEASNILISGTNKTGKSRLAAGICSVLQSFDWKILVFDNSGAWRTISDLPFYVKLRTDSDRYRLPVTSQSLLIDTSNLTIDYQRELVDKTALDLWLHRDQYGSRWILLVFEEFQLFGRTIRSRQTQNLLRIMTAGRNKQIRVLAVTVDLALIDAALIRLCSPRFHARLGVEENSKRKFRAYYGTDWTETATDLKLGEFVRLSTNRLDLVSIPLFKPKRTPRPIRPPAIHTTTSRKNALRRFINFTKQAWREA